MTSAAENHYTERMRQLLNLPVTRLGVAGAQHGYHHLTATLADGRAVFAKAVPGRGQAAPGSGQAAAFAAEANGLRWLAQARAVPVPRVLAVAEDMLVIESLPPGHPTAEAAAGFGSGLARLHAAGADAFGAPAPRSRPEPDIISNSDDQRKFSGSTCPRSRRPACWARTRTA